MAIISRGYVLEAPSITSIRYFVLEMERRQVYRNFTTEEAVNFVLEPGSDSELSDLSEDDDDDMAVAVDPASPTSSIPATNLV